MLVGTTTTPFPFAKRTTVPVETLQVQQSLRDRPVPRLVHPHHAVHALDGATGTHRLAEHARDATIRLRPGHVQAVAHHLSHQVRHRAGATNRPAVRSPRPLPP